MLGPDLGMGWGEAENEREFKTPALTTIHISGEAENKQDE